MTYKLCIWKILFCTSFYDSVVLLPKQNVFVPSVRQSAPSILTRNGRAASYAGSFVHIYPVLASAPGRVWSSGQLSNPRGSEPLLDTQPPTQPGPHFKRHSPTLCVSVLLHCRQGHRCPPASLLTPYPERLLCLPWEGRKPTTVVMPNCPTAVHSQEVESVEVFHHRWGLPSLVLLSPQKQLSFLPRATYIFDKNGFLIVRFIMWTQFKSDITHTCNLFPHTSLSPASIRYQAAAGAAQPQALVLSQLFKVQHSQAATAPTNFLQERNFWPNFCLHDF